jgi:NADH:ubiquinone oxidoreductase subunit 5 (subunit L)/multisubunit Na+/H+ antiporter MnhA subunit
MVCGNVQDDDKKGTVIEGLNSWARPYTRREGKIVLIVLAVMVQFLVVFMSITMGGMIFHGREGISADARQGELRNQSLLILGLILILGVLISIIFK